MFVTKNVPRCSGDTGGYLSDGDLVRARSSLGQQPIYRAQDRSGYTSDNNYDRRAHRIAYEQQRARAEAEHRQYLHVSGKIRQDLQGQAKPTYKVTGARKNVKKSDSGKIFWLELILKWSNISSYCAAAFLQIPQTHIYSKKKKSTEIIF